MKTRLIAMSAVLMFGGCSTFKTLNCGDKAGYQKGYNDARSGKKTDLNGFNLICGADAEPTKEGYQDGYKAGEDEGIQPQLNLGFKNGKAVLTGAYECALEYGGEKFTRKAASPDQAREEVLAKCREKYPFCPDNSITCAKN